MPDLSQNNARMFDRILVVCTGNICRSPIAEALLQRTKPNLRVTSAGTGAVVGAPADPHSVSVCQVNGVDLSAHIARQITPEMLQTNDLILVLDSSHLNWLNGNFPQYRGKVHRLGKWQKEKDVADPYRMPLEAFAACYAEIDGMVADWSKKL
jgi:protein-tyrosine phosphatase